MRAHLRLGALGSTCLLAATLLGPGLAHAAPTEPRPWPGKTAPEPDAEAAAAEPAAAAPGDAAAPATEAEAPAPAKEPDHTDAWGEQAQPAPRPTPQPTAQPEPQPPAPAVTAGPPPDGPVDRPPSRTRRPGVGLMTTGFIILGVSYLSSALTGALLIDGASEFDGEKSSYERARQEAVGVRLTIPFVGPFLAIDPAESASASVALGFVGAIQIGGLGLAATGISKHVRARRGVQTGYTPLPGGGMARVAFRF